MKNKWEASDYLKSNCRSWEYDCDSYEDTLQLASHLQTKFKSLSDEEAFELASWWTGFDKQENDDL